MLHRQVYEPGNGLGFHFDKDERALEERGEMVFPLFSSVVYLTEAQEGRAPLAPTVVMDQALVGGEMSPQRNAGTVLVHPKRDRALLFDGTLAHGVLESVNTTDVRKTLLVNWWKRRPEVRAALSCARPSCPPPAAGGAVPHVISATGARDVVTPAESPVRGAR